MTSLTLLKTFAILIALLHTNTHHVQSDSALSAYYHRSVSFYPSGFFSFVGSAQAESSGAMGDAGLKRENDTNSKANYTFGGRIRQTELTFFSGEPELNLAAFSFPEKSKDDLLADACRHDQKCICLNRAIFVHDSSWATAGVGKRALNPCNMRKPSTWTPAGVTGTTSGAVGKFLVFDSLQSGITACVETYNRFYKNLHYDVLVNRWTAGGGDANYRSALANCM